MSYWQACPFQLKVNFKSNKTRIYIFLNFIFISLIIKKKAERDENERLGERLGVGAFMNQLASIFPGLRVREIKPAPDRTMSKNIFESF